MVYVTFTEGYHAEKRERSKRKFKKKDRKITTPFGVHPSNSSKFKVESVDRKETDDETKSLQRGANHRGIARA
jgi:hypothetical protein